MTIANDRWAAGRPRWEYIEGEPKGRCPFCGKEPYDEDMEEHIGIDHVEHYSKLYAERNRRRREERKNTPLWRKLLGKTYYKW